MATSSFLEAQADARSHLFSEKSDLQRVRQDVEALRALVGELRSELRGEIVRLEARLDTTIAEWRRESQERYVDLTERITRQLQTWTIWSIAMLVPVLAALGALLRLP